MKTIAQAGVVLSIIGIAIALGGQFEFNARVGIMLIIALILGVGLIIKNLRDKNAPFQREQDDLQRIIGYHLTPRIDVWIYKHCDHQ